VSRKSSSLCSPWFSSVEPEATIVYTHKATREGLTVSISIFGEHGEKFARRLSENELDDSEMLSEDVTTADSDGFRRFTFSIEQRPVKPARTTKMAVPARRRREASALVSWFKQRRTPSPAISAPQPLVKKIVLNPTPISFPPPMPQLGQPDANISGTWPTTPSKRTQT
jgi:hypothetical protein